MENILSKINNDTQANMELHFFSHLMGKVKKRKLNFDEDFDDYFLKRKK